MLRINKVYFEGNTNVTIAQYPKFGYPYCFYPFNNQDGYMQPFVMIQLFNLIPNKRVIFCRDELNFIFPAKRN
ncbi:unnamed protein product [Brugia pahangi]|uniref:Uncharacterized protein n=1 Tax=Brugia pahangi TaxID=6280 RepID=A0A0N4TTB2_BRUPA|nr:unnamed protein product [Brugia pahangi]